MFFMVFPGSMQYIESLEKDRKNALSEQDALNYFVLCEELGMTPEDEFLYERGMLEHSLLEEDRISELRIVASYVTSSYKQFYDKGKKLSTSFERDVKEKKANLRNFFKGKRRNGLEDMDDLTVGAMHQRILVYAEKRMQRAH